MVLRGEESGRWGKQAVFLITRSQVISLTGSLLAMESPGSAAEEGEEEEFSRLAIYCGNLVVALDLASEDDAQALKEAMDERLLRGEGACRLDDLLPEGGEIAVNVYLSTEYEGPVPVTLGDESVGIHSDSYLDVYIQGGSMD
jgi:hypothetical protein